MKDLNWLHEYALEALENWNTLISSDIKKTEIKLKELDIIWTQEEIKWKLIKIFSDEEVLLQLDNSIFDMYISYFLYILKEEKESNLENKKKDDLEKKDEIIKLVRSEDFTKIENFIENLEDNEEDKKSFRILLEESFEIVNIAVAIQYSLLSINIEIAKYLFLENFEHIIEKKSLWKIKMSVFSKSGTAGIYQNLIGYMKNITLEKFKILEPILMKKLKTTYIKTLKKEYKINTVSVEKYYYYLDILVKYTDVTSENLEKKFVDAINEYYLSQKNQTST